MGRRVETLSGDERSWLGENERVKLDLRDVQCCGAPKELNAGDGATVRVVLTTQRVLLLANEQRRLLSVPYRDLLMHAVSTDPEAFRQPCVYCQLSASDGSDEDVHEMRLVPDDEESVNIIYNVLCECSELNPDDEAVDVDDDLRTAPLEDELGKMELDDMHAAQARWERLLRGSARVDSDARDSDGRFEDVEDDETDDVVDDNNT